MEQVGIQCCLLLLVSHKLFLPFLTAHRALSSRSLVRWPSSEALLSWPDLLSNPSIMGNTIQKLKRGQASRHLGLEAPLAAEEDSLSLGVHQGQPRYFSASGGCEQHCSLPNAAGVCKRSNLVLGSSREAEQQSLPPNWLQFARQKWGSYF